MSRPLGDVAMGTGYFRLPSDSVTSSSSLMQLSLPALAFLYSIEGLPVGLTFYSYCFGCCGVYSCSIFSTTGRLILGLSGSSYSLINSSNSSPMVSRAF